MVRARVAVIAAAVICSASLAEAQVEFAGYLTGHLGVALARDVRDPATTPGLSLAVIDDNGIGVELDLAHMIDFDDALFADSSVTSAMLNFVAMYPHDTFRPFVAVGAGLMRVRTAIFANQPLSGRTEAGWTSGGGVLYMVNEAVGLRGEARYFRHFQGHGDLPLGGDGVLDFWRISAGATFTWPMS